MSGTIRAAESDATIVMPTPKVAVPESGEEYILVRMREWARLKSKIKSLKKHRRHWANAGWALIGIGASAGFSWFPYLAAGSASDVTAIITLVVAVTGLATGSLSLLFGHEAQKTLAGAVHEAQVLMSDMEAHLDQARKEKIWEITEEFILD